MRFRFDPRKSKKLRSARGIGFEEAQEIFTRPYYLYQRTDFPEQYRAIGWVGALMYSVIFEAHEDIEGESYRLITLWRSTSEERKLYEENS